MVTESILAEITAVLARVKEEDLNKMTERIAGAKRIFVLGEGRSGLMAKAFAMRLMHLGAEVFVTGETIAPAIGAGDLLIAVSGSGTTHHVVWTAKKAQENGARIQAVSTNDESPLSDIADALLLVPAATKFRREKEAPSIQPLGSLFDQSAHILFDTICLQYAEKKKISQAEAFQRHSNLEA